MKTFANPHIRHICSRLPAALLAILLLTTLPASPLHARQPADQPAPAAVHFNTEPYTAARIESLRASVEADAELDDTLRTQILANLDAAAAALRNTELLAEEAARFEADRLDAPRIVEQVREQLAQPTPDPLDGVGPETTFEQIRQFLAQAEADLEAARARQRELDAEPARRAARIAAVPGEIALAAQRTEQLEEELAALGEPDPADARAVSQRLLILAQIREQTELSRALEAEKTSYEGRSDALQARRERAAWRVFNAERRVAALRAVFEQQAMREAELEAERAQRVLRELDDAHPAIRELAREHAALTQQLVGPHGFVARRAEARAQRDRARATLDRLLAEFEDTRIKVDRIGLTESVGVLLQRRRADLPDTRSLRARIRARQTESTNAFIERFTLEERRAEIGDVAAAVERIVDQLRQDVPPERIPQLRRLVLDTLSNTVRLLERTAEQYEQHGETLFELDSIDRDTIEITEAYRAYIDARVLWVRSAGPVGPRELLLVWRGLADLLGPTRTSQALESFWVRHRQDPGKAAGSLITLAALLIVFALQRRARTAMRALNSRVSSAATDSFKLTAGALALTVFIAAPWALLLWWISTLFATDPSAAAAPWVRGLELSALLLFTLSLLRQVCRRGGLGEVHFGWPPRSLAVIRGNLAWFTPTFVPLTFLVIASDPSVTDAGSEALARAAFIAAQIVTAAFLWRVLRPSGDVIAPILAAAPDGWLCRLRHIWYPLAVGLPILLAALAAWGYLFTALQLNHSLHATLWLVLALLLLHALLSRMLFIARRRIALEESRKRRDAAIAQADGEAAGEAPPTPPQDPGVDIPAIDAQTRQLVRTGVGFAGLLGLWLVWVNVLPALAVLDRFEVWPEFGRIAETQDLWDQYRPLLDPVAATRPDTTPEAPPPARQTAPAQPRDPRMTMLERHEDPPATDRTDDTRAVTLAHIALAVLIAILTGVLTRNVPGLLEIILLQRLPLEPGVRYAVSSVAKYAIGIIGVAVAFGVIGIGWSNVQWLAAALTFGLAFGLQEIFANFVSGLIILFERPVRVGDVVTIGDVSGRVTRIRMRATTIVDWDRKELIVPNKEFITGQLINWTLSDPVLRIVVPVGIAYGSDTDAARRILLQCARDNPNVLADPEPSVLFREFGDSALNFDLRVFIPSIEFFVAARDSLHCAIDKAFREAGIEIAFPQRDIHIRSIAGAVKLVDTTDNTPRDNA